MFYILCGIQLVASAGHVALVLFGHVETSVSPNEQLCSAHAGAEQSVWEGGPPVGSYSSYTIANFSDFGNCPSLKLVFTSDTRYGRCVLSVSWRRSVGIGSI